MNEHIIGFVNISYENTLYVVEICLKDPHSWAKYLDFTDLKDQLFVCIYRNTRSSELIAGTWVQRLRKFEITNVWPSQLLDMIEYEARRLEQMKAFW